MTSESRPQVHRKTSKAPIDPAPDPQSQRADRLIAVAREIIRERGAFNLTMRELAARAQVSLRSVYGLFGSKAGIISAILQADQAAWGKTVSARLKESDAFDHQFELLHLGIEWFRRREEFYRALFQASQAYSDGDEADASRENQGVFTRWVGRALGEGLIDPGTDPHALGGAMTDIFAANMRVWALTGCDRRLLEARIGYGFATIFAAVATDAHVGRMREKARAMQATIAEFSSAQP